MKKVKEIEKKILFLATLLEEYTKESDYNTILTEKTCLIMTK